MGKLRVKIMVKVGGNIFGALLGFIFLFDEVGIAEVIIDDEQFAELSKPK